MKPPPANMDPSPPPAPEYIPVCNETNAQKNKNKNCYSQQETQITSKQKKTQAKKKKAVGR
jgi:hypothetical protein